MDKELSPSQQGPHVLLAQPRGAPVVDEEHPKAKAAKNLTTVLYSVVITEWGPPWGHTAKRGYFKVVYGGGEVQISPIRGVEFFSPDSGPM